jgi:glycosyltransferase involved in cell wall biosynthesis
MIYINGRFLTMPITGVQRYALELSNALDDLLQESLPGVGTPITCLVPPDCTQKPEWQKIEVRAVGSFTGNLWEQIDLPGHARDGLLFSPANIGPYFHPNQVVTIHDASVFAYPQAYSLAFRFKYRLMFRRLAKVARTIITVSRFSQGELRRYCRFPQERIAIIAHGSEHLERLTSDETILDRYGIRDRAYFLGVGSWSIHKNLDAVVKAFRLLDREELRLVLVGGKFERVFHSSDIDLPANTIRLGYVSDAGLQALYQNAIALVFSSKYEGFGLPVLEAMAAGCPVICARSSSLPEVGGDAVLYFDPDDVRELSDRMRLLLDSESMQKSLRMKGKARSRKFSWKETARKTWEVLSG